MKVEERERERERERARERESESDWRRKGKRKKRVDGECESGREMGRGERIRKRNRKE